MRSGAAERREHIARERSARMKDSFAFPARFASELSRGISKSVIGVADPYDVGVRACAIERNCFGAHFTGQRRRSPSRCRGVAESHSVNPEAGPAQRWTQ